MPASVLAEGLLETSYPKSLKPEDFDFTSGIAINPSAKYDRRSIVFSADLEGAAGALVAVVLDPPRKPGYIDQLARSGTLAPKQRTEVVLGTGTVRLAERQAGGLPDAERTLIGLDVPLDADAVRSLLAIRVKLELRS
jgi:hypothetical protein